MADATVSEHPGALLVDVYALKAFILIATVPTEVTGLR